MKATQLAIATAVFTCLTAWSGYALATQPGNNGGGNGGCGVGQQTNGCGSTGGSATGGSANASAGAVGVGVGIGYGQGGAGGDAKAYGGAGGSANVIGSGNSSVKNENSNANIQGQQQGQGQSQSARSNQSQSNSSRNSIEGGNGSGNVSNLGVTVAGDNYEAARIPVSTAYAAPLTSANGTCMGSSSGGAQGANFGFTIGSTWTDSGCDARYDATALVQAGQPKAAITRLCLKAEIAQAMKDAGTPCPGSAGQTKRADGEGFAAPQVAQNYQDPIIRARLGLPPLK